MKTITTYFPPTVGMAEVKIEGGFALSYGGTNQAGGNLLLNGDEQEF